MTSHFFKDKETESFMEEMFKNVFRDCDKNEVESWLRTTPANTSLRVSLDAISRKDFIQKLEELIRSKFEEKDYQIVPHPAVEDAVVVVKTFEDEVEPLAGDQVVVVGSMCGAAVLRGADVYAPGNLIYIELTLQDLTFIINKIFAFSITEKSCLKIYNTFSFNKFNT